MPCSSTISANASADSGGVTGRVPDTISASSLRAGGAAPFAREFAQQGRVLGLEAATHLRVRASGLLEVELEVELEQCRQRLGRGFGPAADRAGFAGDRGPAIGRVARRGRYRGRLCGRPRGAQLRFLDAVAVGFGQQHLQHLPQQQDVAVGGEGEAHAPALAVVEQQPLEVAAAVLAAPAGGQLLDDVRKRRARPRRRSGGRRTLSHCGVCALNCRWNSSASWRNSFSLPCVR